MISLRDLVQHLVGGAPASVREAGRMVGQRQHPRMEKSMQMMQPMPRMGYDGKPEYPNADQGMLLNPAVRAEDDNLVHGMQTPMPMNSDISSFFNPHFQANSINPGYVPMQNGGFGGMGYTANLQPANVHWQNTDGQLRNMVNPQVRDRGYFFDR